MVQNTETSPWRLPRFLGVVLLIIIGLFALSRAQQKRGVVDQTSGLMPPNAAVSEQTVSMAFVPDPSHDGAADMPIFSALPWSENMTVLDAMNLAKKYPPHFEFNVIGSGESAFVTEVAGIANDRRQGLYWQFWVNSDRGNRGCGVYELQPGDRVLWKFAAEE